MSTIKFGSVQIGTSQTASNNFHWRNLLDGLLRLSRGNAGSPITDVMRVKADNSVEFPGGVVDPRTVQVVTGSRSFGTTFTNTDLFPRDVFVSAALGTASTSISGNVNGNLFAYAQGTINGAVGYSIYFRVLPGETYSVTQTGGATLNQWVERKV